MVWKPSEALHIVCIDNIIWNDPTATSIQQPQQNQLKNQTEKNQSQIILINYV